jgi:hypothetical protein
MAVPPPKTLGFASREELFRAADFSLGSFSRN